VAGLQKAIPQDTTARRLSSPLAKIAYSYTAESLEVRGIPQAQGLTPAAAGAEPPSPLSLEPGDDTSASPADILSMPAEDENEPTIGGFSITQMLKEIDASKKGATTLADVEEMLRKYAAMDKARKV